MIYVNDVLVTEEKTLELAEKALKVYLATEKLVLTGQNEELLTEKEIEQMLVNLSTTIKLTATGSSKILMDFKEELHTYMLKVEAYIETTRETEDYSSIMASFVQVTEALLEFEAVANFLEKNLIDQEQIQTISIKALEQAEEGNTEYLLDLMEYELLPILQHFIDETNMVM